jgi:sorbose reductase
MTSKRTELTAQVLPQMTLGTGLPRSLTAPPSPLSMSPSPAERAHERFRLSGNAIITGGAGDLGFAVSRALLEHGVQGLVIFDVNPTEAEARASVLGDEFPGASIRFLKVDIKDEAVVDAAVAETVALLGPVTTLLNVAGMVCCGHALEWTPNDWNRVFKCEYDSGLFCGLRCGKTYDCAQNRG